MSRAYGTQNAERRTPNAEQHRTQRGSAHCAPQTTNKHPCTTTTTTPRRGASHDTCERRTEYELTIARPGGSRTLETSTSNRDTNRRQTRQQNRPIHDVRRPEPPASASLQQKPADIKPKASSKSIRRSRLDDTFGRKSAPRPLGPLCPSRDEAQPTRCVRSHRSRSTIAIHLLWHTLTCDLLSPAHTRTH